MQWGATDKEVVQSWMAFKELLGNGIVSANIGSAGARAAEHGWANNWGICTNKYFLGRILGSPEDFRLGHDSFGFDVLDSSYGCVNPGDLPRMLAECSGKNDIEDLFNQQEVVKEVRRLALARKNESFTREVQRLEAESRNRQGHPGLRWWMRDFNELPIGPEKLVEHAKILHEQAKDAVRDATFLWGPLCGSVCGVVLGILYVSMKILNIMAMPVLEAWKAIAQGGGQTVGNQFASASIDVGGDLLVAWLVGALLGAWCGFHLGNNRAFRLRSMATIAISLVRIEFKLSALDNENGQQG